MTAVITGCLFKKYFRVLLMRQKNNRSSNQFSANNSVKFLRSGSGYFRLMEEMIGKASESIHLQTYIFREDETGNRILHALMSAARRGVKTYLIADGYASRQISPATIHLLREAGVHFRFFPAVVKKRSLLLWTAYAS